MRRQAGQALQFADLLRIQRVNLFFQLGQFSFLLLDHLFLFLCVFQLAVQSFLFLGQTLVYPLLLLPPFPDFIIQLHPQAVDLFLGLENGFTPLGIRFFYGIGHHLLGRFFSRCYFGFSNELADYITADKGQDCADQCCYYSCGNNRHLLTKNKVSLPLA